MLRARLCLPDPETPSKRQVIAMKIRLLFLLLFSGVVSAYSAAVPRVNGVGVVATNDGPHYVISTGSTTARGVHDRFSERINIKDHGATGNGTASDQAAWNAAYALAVARGHGTIYFPHSTGLYLLNAVITNDNIAIIGELRDVKDNATYGIAPWDTTKPTIQVGNDTRNVNGFSARDLAIFGNRGTTNGPGALHFLGGAWRGDAENVQLIGGADTLKFKAGGTYASTMNSVRNFAAWEGTNSTVWVDDTRTGAGFCTGTYLSDGNINGHNTSGYAIRVTRGVLNLANVYLDGASDRSIYLRTGGGISAVNSDLENASGGAGYLVTVDYTGETYTERNVERFVQGSGARMQGKVKWTDDTGTVETQIPTATSGFANAFDRATLRKPWVTFPLSFGTVANPHDGIYAMDMDSTNGPLTFGKSSARDLDIKYKGTNIFTTFGAPGDVRPGFYVDAINTGANGSDFRLWRQTTNNGTKVFTIFQGNGSANQQVVIDSFGNTFFNGLAGNFGIGAGATTPTDKLHVDGSIRLDGHLYFGGTDNLRDIGESAARRPRRIYVGTGITLPTGDLQTLINGRQPLDSDLTTIANNNPGNTFYFGTDSSGTKGFFVFPGTASHTNTVTIACSDLTTALTTGANKGYWRAPFNCTVVDVRASVLTASSSGLVTVDVNEAGASIFTTTLTIDATEKTSTTAATPYVIGGAGPAVANDAEITIDIDASGTNAAGLLVTIYYVRTS